MITFDKMKIISDIRNISDINRDMFLANIKNDEVLYYKYQQERPYYLLLMIDYQRGELVIEFTGKILLDRYTSLISKDTIRDCLLQINRMGVCYIDINNVLTHSYVTKCDVTKDVTETDIERIISYIRQNIISYQKWIVKGYRGGISLENVCKTPRYKKRLVIYDKAKELQKAENVNFLNAVADKDQILSYFKDKVRFELNINTMAQIRSLLNIADNDLQTVLSATANPILSVLDEAVIYCRPQQRKQTLRDYEHELLLKECDYDLVKVEAKVRALSSANTSIKRVMQPYKDIKNYLQASSVPVFDIRKLVV